jgi:hypothetical protein
VRPEARILLPVETAERWLASHAEWLLTGDMTPHELMQQLRAELERKFLVPTPKEKT